jgi:hypothetical protein
MRFSGPSVDPLARSMDRAAAVMSTASAEMLRAVAEYDRGKRWRAAGATSMTSWLAARYGFACGTAREWVRVARALRLLLEIARAHQKGQLSWDQLKPLTRFATPDTDAHWARRAPGLRPAALRLEPARHEQVRAEEAREDHRRRFLWLTWDHERPVLWIEGMLPAEQGSVVKAALERRVDRVPSDPEAHDPPGARMADTLLEALAGPSAQDAPPATVVVHAGAEALVGKEPHRGAMAGRNRGRSEARRGGGAPPGLRREDRVGPGAGGPPGGIGRQGRAVPGAVGRILRHRVRTCRFPGCERRPWLHAHHLVHRADGGATNLDNLVLLVPRPPPPDPRGRVADEHPGRTSGSMTPWGGPCPPSRPGRVRRFSLGLRRGRSPGGPHSASPS